MGREGVGVAFNDRGFVDGRDERGENACWPSS